jgi:tripartite-type tricarboxylate transporter receptor subunit TctC
MKYLPRQNLHLTGLIAAVAGLSVLSVTLSGHGASSQTPQNLKIVVPYAPGGAATVLARLLADKVERAQKGTTLVENRPGAGSVVGTEAVARAAPDGSTLLITNSAILINPHLRKQNYDPLTSFEPICNLVKTPLFITVNSASPYHTLNDFLAAARGKPGQMTFASFTGTGAHIAFEMLKHSARIDITFVPYPGSAPAITALLGEQITSISDNYATMAEHLNAGKLRALATFSPMRIESLPDIPTVSESGYKNSEVDEWFGLFAPAKTPKETVVQLVSWFSAAIELPDVKQKLAPLGLYPIRMCGADFTNLLQRQDDEYRRAIRDANLKVE